MQNLPDAPFPIFFTGLPIFSLSVHFYSHSLNTETSDFPRPLCSCIKWLLVVTYWLWLLFQFIYYQGLTAIRIVCECIHLHRQFIGYPSIHPSIQALYTHLQRAIYYNASCRESCRFLKIFSFTTRRRPVLWFYTKEFQTNFVPKRDNGRAATKTFATAITFTH